MLNLQVAFLTQTSSNDRLACFQGGLSYKQHMMFCFKINITVHFCDQICHSHKVQSERDKQCRRQSGLNINSIPLQLTSLLEASLDFTTR